MTRAMPMKASRRTMLGSSGSMSRSVRLSRQNSQSRLRWSEIGTARTAVTPSTSTEHTRTQSRSRKAKCSRRRVRPSTKKGRKLRTRPSERVMPRSAVAANSEMITAMATGQRRRCHTGTLRRHRNSATRNHRVQVGLSTDSESGSPPRSSV